MNNYGVILTEIGMEPFLDFVQNLVRPVGEATWGRAGAQWDSHHTFIVQYSQGKDKGLDMHTDDSDITTNIALMDEKSIDGSEVRFCGMMYSSEHRKETCKYVNKKGIAIQHSGRHRHG